MPDSYTLTQNYGIDLILPELMFDEMSDSDSLIDLLPLTYEDYDLIKWNQHENGYGLLSLRGLGGEPGIAGVPGIREYAVAPGYYGERAILDEVEMTKSRDAGTPNLPADPAERIAIITQYQATKSVTRIRQTIADILLTGQFTNRDQQGRVIHSDKIENYRTFTIAGGTLSVTGAQLGPGWASDPVNATPLDDLAAIQNELHLGTSSRFGRDSKIFCQTSVINDFLATKQVRDSYRSEYGASFIGLEGANKLMAGRGLPTFEVFDEGYYTDLASSVNRTLANFTRILPVKKMIWAGTRPRGQKLGKFVFTRNQGNSPPAGYPAPPKNPLSDKYKWAEGLYIRCEYIHRMPFRFELDVGFNGGPRIDFGSAAAGISYA